MAVELRLLGAVRASVDGAAVDLGSPRQRCVLVALLVDINQVVPPDQLVYRVWGDRPPERALGTLYSYISKLRKALAAANIGIARESGGYRLSGDAALVDLHRFRQLAAEARRTDDEHALALLEQALRQWRGEAFATLETPWLDQLRIRLDAERHAVGLDRNDLKLRLGRHSELIAELTSQVAEHQLDERLAGQLMLALYRGGRQADALRIYRETRAALVDELGLEPGPELQRLHRQILAIDGVETVDRARRRSDAMPVPRQLPADVANFVGRDVQLGELEALRDRSAILVIDGMAGSGKTALAVRFGHRIARGFPDGQLYVDLRGYAPVPPMTAAEALGQFLRSLGLPAGRIPGDEQEAAAAFRSLLADQRMLVVLDNARSATQVRPLLPGGSDCLTVITSRRRLTTLDGASSLHLDVLSERESLSLLGTLAGSDRIATEPAAAARLTSLCAGLPLALRIAGARLSTHPPWPLRKLVDQLADARHRLDELVVDDRAMRASFEVSYRALQTSDAALAFRRLGALDWAEMTVPIAAALLDLPQPDARAALERLADDHLLDRAATGRYEAHDLIRLYAHELDDPGRPAALLRAAESYIAAAEHATLLLDPTNRRIPHDPTRERRSGLTLRTSADALAWIEAEHANLIAAARQAASAPDPGPALAVRLTAALNRPLERRGYWRDLIALCETAADIANDLDDRGAEALAQLHLAFAYQRVGRTPEAATTMRGALAAWRDVGDRGGEQNSLFSLGAIYRSQERFGDALNCLEQSLAISREIGSRPGESASLEGLGLVYQRLGRFDEAIACHKQSLAIGRELGYRYGEAAALANLGWAYHRAGRTEQSIGYHQQSLAVAGEIGHRLMEAESLWGLGQSHLALGRPDQARTHWSRSIAILTELGELTGDEAETLARQPIPETPAIIQRTT